VTQSSIVDNQSTGGAIVIGAQNRNLAITGNLVRSRAAAINILRGGFIDQFPAPSRDVIVGGNDVRSTASAGIFAQAGSLVDSLIAANTSSSNFGTGISLVSDGVTEPADNTVTGNVVEHNGAGGIFASQQGSDIAGNLVTHNAFGGIALSVGATGNRVEDNVADDNGRNGIVAVLGATGNAFVDNSMHGNGTSNPAAFFDAFDGNTPINTWTGNDCDTDYPAGAICGVG
jgi:parallel beta-helix repeat protein